MIVCLYRDEDVATTVVDGGLLDAMAPGTVLVVHTTGSPDTGRGLQRGAGDGPTVIDAPMSGTVEDVARGTLTLLAGGPAAALERARPVLASYADPILHVGELGDGQRVKLLNNLAFAANLEVAARLAQAMHDFGIDQATATGALTRCTGASRALQMLTQFESVQELVAVTAPFLAKDLAVLRRQAHEAGVDLAVLATLSSAFAARWTGM